METSSHPPHFHTCKEKVFQAVVSWSFCPTEVWRTWSRTHHQWKSAFLTSSLRGCWRTLTLPRSSLLISVSLQHRVACYCSVLNVSADVAAVKIQRRWPPVGRPTNLLMTRKSSSLPRLGALVATESLMCSYICFFFCFFLFVKVFISSAQVLLPLTDQTFKNHCLYFLSTPSKNLSSSGCASNKEKEMVTRYDVESNFSVMFLQIRVFSFPVFFLFPST